MKKSKKEYSLTKCIQTKDVITQGHRYNGKSWDQIKVHTDEDNALYGEVLRFITLPTSRVAIPAFQRAFRIPYNKAKELVQRLEDDGYITAGIGASPRKLIRIPKEDQVPDSMMLRKIT